MGKHTPGPWIVEIRTLPSTGRPTYEVIPQGPSMLKLDKKEALANARLIAVAPNMLDALKELLAVQLRRQNGQVLKLSDWENAHNRAAQVIREAEG